MVAPASGERCRAGASNLGFVGCHCKGHGHAKRYSHRRRSSNMTGLAVAIFIVVYLGMILGGLPFLQLDRTGVALLGAIALIGTDVLTLDEAARAIHLPTVILLFSFMVVSAQMRLGGFYDWVTRRLTELPLAPPLLLGALIVATAGLAAVFSNDILCLAVAPGLTDASRARRPQP